MLRTQSFKLWFINSTLIEHNRYFATSIVRLSETEQSQSTHQKTKTKQIDNIIHPTNKQLKYKHRH